MSRRSERVASLIREEVAQMILHDLNDPRLTGLPSITRVRVSDDLSIADIYVTVMGTEGHQNAAVNALRHSAGLMRSKLTRSMSLRVAPYLKFHLDENLRRELDMMALLDKVSKENAELDRKRAAAASGEQGTEDQTE